MPNLAATIADDHMVAMFLHAGYFFKCLLSEWLIGVSANFRKRTRVRCRNEELKPTPGNAQEFSVGPSPPPHRIPSSSGECHLLSNRLARLLALAAFSGTRLTVSIIRKRFARLGTMAAALRTAISHHG